MSFRIDQLGILRWAPWEEIAWLEHGFSTRATGDFSDPAVRTETASLFGAVEMECIGLRQVHSARVVDVSEAERKPPAEADAVLSDRPGALLTLRTADCAAVLLLDRSRRAVAAVHAGWRGAAERIVERAVGEMALRYGSLPAEIEAASGPAIGVERFEVGEEVAERFPAESVRRTPGRPRPFLDLQGEVRRQLTAAGLADEAIAVADLCTWEREDLFFSYRRAGAQAGRMAAIVGVRGVGC